jgi:hypothetical protein
VAGLHGGNGSVQQRHLRINLIGVHVGEEDGGAAAVGRAVLQAGLLVIGRQQLVFVAAAVAGREVGTGQFLREVADLVGGGGQTRGGRGVGAVFAAVLVGQVLVAVAVAVDFGFGFQALRLVFEAIPIVGHNGQTGERVRELFGLNIVNGSGYASGPGGSRAARAAASASRASARRRSRW